jgi:hypothetical protein
MDATIRYPLQPQPRTVLFTDSAPWQPGNAETAILAARLLPRAWQHSWTPSHPVVVLTGPRFGALSEHDRDLIWRRWGVPVFEYLTDAAGALVARECDAHEGLHICAAHSGLDAVAKVRECGCGISGPMLTRTVPAEVAAA